MTRASSARNERRQLGTNKQTHAHKMVAETAQGMAHEVWDKIMTTRGDIFERFKNQPDNAGLTTKELETKFCAKLWPTMLDEARATLARMLTLPSTSPLQKEQIYDALRLDNTLLRGRERAHTVGRLN